MDIAQNQLMGIESDKIAIIAGLTFTITNYK